MLLTLLVLAAAADAAEPVYRCAPTTQPIKIDGKLDDGAWTTASWTQEFVHLRGDDKPPRTRAKFSCDDRHLYVAAELSEADVRAEMTAHDSPVYRENAVELFIDPDNDGENYLELQINALNTTFDLLMSKPYAQRGKPDERWEIAGLRTAVHVDGTLNDAADQDESWTVELAIPWAAMKELTAEPLPPKPGSRWRVNLARVIVGRDGKARYATWSRVNGASLHVPRRWGWVEFSPARSDTPARASPPPDRKSR